MTQSQIIPKTIIERGYTTDEEYEIMVEGKGLEKLTLRCKDGSEGIWIYPLENSDKVGTKFRFVFCNDPIEFIGGPRPTSGMIGIAKSNGRNDRAVADASECLEMFKKTGTAAIEYFQKQRNAESHNLKEGTK